MGYFFILFFFSCFAACSASLHTHTDTSIPVHPKAAKRQRHRQGMGQEPHLWQYASHHGQPLALPRKCSNFLINLIWKSKAFSFKSCPASGSLMDTRQGWQGVKHGPAHRRSNYCYQREKRDLLLGWGGQQRVSGS